MIKSFMAFALIACSSATLMAADAKPKTEEVATNTAKLNVKGMTCKGCVNKATVTLESVPGVKSVVVDLKTATATITTDDSGKYKSASAITALSKKGLQGSVKK